MLEIPFFDLVYNELNSSRVWNETIINSCPTLMMTTFHWLSSPRDNQDLDPNWIILKKKEGYQFQNLRLSLNFTWFWSESFAENSILGISRQHVNSNRDLSIITYFELIFMLHCCPHNKILLWVNLNKCFLWILQSRKTWLDLSNTFEKSVYNLVIWTLKPSTIFYFTLKKNT